MGGGGGAKLPTPLPSTPSSKEEIAFSDKNNVEKKWGDNENIWLNNKSWTSYGVLASNPALVWFYMTFYNWKKRQDTVGVGKK